MNRREFLARVPAVASVPALLSLPAVAGEPSLEELHRGCTFLDCKAWLRELERQIAMIPDYFVRGDMDYWNDYRIVVACPHGGPEPRRVNATPIGKARPGTVLTLGRYYSWLGPEPIRVAGFAVFPPIPWNSRWGLYRGLDWRVYPEVDFYSL